MRKSQECYSRRRLDFPLTTLVRRFSARITHFSKVLLPKDCRFVGVVFELEQVVRRVFQKECAVFDARPRKAHTGLLIERQSFGLRPIRQRLPIPKREKHQSEMARIDALLFRRLIRHEMRDELVARQTERDGMLRSSSDATAKAIDVELKRGFHVVNRKGEMKDYLRHFQMLCLGSPRSEHCEYFSSKSATA